MRAYRRRPGAALVEGASCSASVAVRKQWSKNLLNPWRLDADALAAVDADELDQFLHSGLGRLWRAAS